MTQAKLVRDKQELAEEIMAHAIEKVIKLGFRMKVGKPGSSMNPELLPGARNIIFYSTDADRRELRSLEHAPNPVAQVK